MNPIKDNNSQKVSISENSDLSQSGTSSPDSGSPILRGALKLEVSTSTPIVTAGTEFSIFVVIRNPFPVPITIYATETHIPIELVDCIWKKQNARKNEKERQEALETLNTSIKRFIRKAGYWFSDLAEMLFPDTGPRVAIAVSPEVYDALSRVANKIEIGAISEIDGAVNIAGQNIWNLNFSNMSQEEVKAILWDINEYMAGRKPVTLRPGNSIVQHFILKTTHWLMFTPIAHTFQIQVRYEIDGRPNVDTIPYSLGVRAPMTSSLVGAIIGSILGTLVSKNSVNVLSPVEISRTLLAAMIFAIIIVVAFARKSTVQQVVSVEDFWGGIFLGFLVGYSGETFINRIIGSS